MTQVDEPQVITFGETMLRFSPSGFSRLEQSSEVEVHVGGSESNTAVGLARLGHRVQWISRLTDNPMGRRIANSISSHGVDCSQLIWTQNDRIGTYYMERGAGPRHSQVYYDRAQSAMSRIQPGDLLVDMFPSEDKTDSSIFHTTGITLGISASARATALEAQRRAKSSGLLISFDLNYRAKLWEPSEAASYCDDFAKNCDLILLPIRDARTLYGIDSLPESTCLSLRERWPLATIVLTLGEKGSCLLTRQNTFIHQVAFPTQEVERLGSGDAFSAGFLAGMLRNLSESDCLKLGNAAAAIKYTIPGDFPVFDRSTVEQLAFSDALSKEIQR